ncbi:MAG: hypothetical protein LBU82_04965 [Treponema sp.]|nr:hypothetical protein [Treponema sp.]
MRKEITALTLRDFGVHSRGKKFKEETGSAQPEGYYDELIEFFTQRIWQLLDNLILNITAGNSIFPVTLEELATRRMYQNAAIVNCEQLLQEILYCEDVMPKKASTFIPYVEKIEFEIRLLRGWRKSNTKLKERIETLKTKKENGGEKKE